MEQTALLEFESSAFALSPGEDEETNPGIFGKSLAQWIAGQLVDHGFAVSDLVAEDFGWCVRVKTKSPRLFVACANVEGKANQWRVFAFAERGALARLLGKGKSTESLASLHSAIKQSLASSPLIQGIREVAS